MGKFFSTTFVCLTIFFIASVATCVAIPMKAQHQVDIAEEVEHGADVVQAVIHDIHRRGIVSPSSNELLHNTIAFGIPSVLFFFMRILNSVWVLKKFRLEDYLMCVTFFFYCSLLTFINVSAKYNSNLFPTEEEAAILADPDDVRNRIMGSILVIPLEQSMLLSTWGVKTCIWLFLRRLCRSLPKFQFALNCLIVYIWLGYAVIQIFYYAIACRPFKQYWAVPVQNEQCATYSHYSIIQMLFNITSDVGLIVIPVVMFSIARLPWKRRLLLICVFSMAVFTIIAAILNKVYNFLSPLTTVYQLWYIREASVAMQVGNIICCWQLGQKLFKLRSFDNKSPNIDADPEMAAHRYGEDSTIWSSGGTRRDDTWFAKHSASIGFRGGWANRSQPFLSQASRSFGSQPDLTQTDQCEMTSNILVDGKGTSSTVDAVEAVETVEDVNRGDDPGPAIAYCNREDIV